jgi:hypothetical protein
MRNNNNNKTRFEFDTLKVFLKDLEHDIFLNPFLLIYQKHVICMIGSEGSKADCTDVRATSGKT